MNKVQLDIRQGHAQTVDKVLNWLQEEGGVKGTTICDAGCGTGGFGRGGGEGSSIEKWIAAAGCKWSFGSLFARSCVVGSGEQQVAFRMPAAVLHPSSSNSNAAEVCQHAAQGVLPYCCL